LTAARSQAALPARRKYERIVIAKSHMAATKQSLTPLVNQALGQKLQLRFSGLQQNEKGKQ
jgi:hypothetical protein